MLPDSLKKFTCHCFESLISWSQWIWSKLCPLTSLKKIQNKQIPKHLATQQRNSGEIIQGGLDQTRIHVNNIENKETRVSTDHDLSK